ncbi:MAG: ABC-2 transporter permease [Oscillospiraceae bacterium]|nr:ABC-2 transporter permease [Oscillospiraceae bacterium]
MKKLLNKELRLAASPLSYIFLAASFMTLLPGYPILMGAFFVCFGVFHSFQNAREANDTLYTVLLPVKKRDFVLAKYTFTCAIELIGFVIMAVLTAVRMTALSGAEPYRVNALMNATPLFLAFALLVFAAFNVFFLGGFFKTAYAIGIPFLCFGIATFVLIGVGEVLHHLPGMAFLNVQAGERLAVQFVVLAAAAVVSVAATLLSFRASAAKFERIDL